MSDLATRTDPMPIPRRWSSHSQAKGDWRMDPQGQWVIWADVADVIEWATPRLVVSTFMARWPEGSCPECYEAGTPERPICEPHGHDLTTTSVTLCDPHGHTVR